MCAMIISLFENVNIIRRKIIISFVIQTIQSFRVGVYVQLRKNLFRCITFTGCLNTEGKIRKNKFQINNRFFSFKVSFSLKIENLSSVFELQTCQGLITNKELSYL